MDPTSLTPEAAATIHRLLAEHGVDASYQAFVARHLEQPDGSWRWCCGSHCDPCVQRLGLVVDLARRALGVTPPEGPGLPNPTPPI
ncbi:MAG: hypothetical protein MUC36_22435 [Planctomycetes bacterium]|jgi:hypothetical protein|nr:hypothetical protein [Planctomycetota bacterium]